MTMTTTEVYEKVAEAVAERFDLKVADVTPELNFVKDVHGDSIDFVEMVVEVEDLFTVTITDADAAELQTVGQLVDYIAARQPQ